MPLSLHIPPQTQKPACIVLIEAFVSSLGFIVTERDYEKPWGGYLRIDESQIDMFTAVFFKGVEVRVQGKLTPKILFVAPHQRLSWQYHHRRTELWRVVTGPVQAEKSENDTETPPVSYAVGDLIDLGPQVRHRLIGADSWGVVAEIWQHAEPTNPSNEQDIVRVQDDFGR
ncbi:MAG: phosphoheptose isomerase [bacterium]